MLLMKNGGLVYNILFGTSQVITLVSGLMSEKWQSRQLQSLISLQKHLKSSRNFQNQLYQNFGKQPKVQGIQVKVALKKQMKMCRKCYDTVLTLSLLLQAAVVLLESLTTCILSVGPSSLEEAEQTSFKNCCLCLFQAVWAT